MKKLLLVLFMTATISSIWSQFDYSKGSHVGLSLITVKNIGANFGLYGGTEFGQGEKWKFEVIGNFCPFKTKMGDYMVYSDFNSTTVPYELFVRYLSANLGARYYFKDVYEDGHNFHLDGGLLVQYNFYETKSTDVLPIEIRSGGVQINYGAFIGAGYQYSFESGLILQTRISYEQKIGTIYNNYSHSANANSAFIIGAGVKYRFSLNFNWQSYRGL